MNQQKINYPRMAVRLADKFIKVLMKEMIDKNKEKKKNDEKDTCGDSNTGR